jgi:large subunit ribosomal protein L9
MKVLLLNEVAKVGRKGEIVEVSEGYAKNFLLRKKLAQIATSQIIFEYNQRKEKEGKLRQEKAKEIESFAEKISEQNFQFRVKTGKNGEIFSSVNSPQIRQKILKYLKNSGGPALTEDDIQFESKPIKELGNKKIVAKLGKGENVRNVQISIEILPEEQ